MSTQVYRERVTRNSNGEKIFHEEVFRNDSPVVYSASRTYSGVRVIYYLLDVVETILALRVALVALGASAASAFVNFVYSLSAPFVAPFRSIFPAYHTAGFALDWPAIVAMIVYALVAYAIVQLVELAQDV